MSGSSRPTGFSVSAAWYRRERVEVVKLGVQELVGFLNQFDQSVRSKLATLDQRLEALESTLEVLEHASGLQGPAPE